MFEHLLSMLRVNCNVFKFERIAFLYDITFQKSYRLTPSLIACSSI